MTRPQLFTAVFFALLLVLLYQIVLMFRPFLFPVLWAALLAHTTFPIHERLSVWFGERQTLSAWIEESRAVAARNQRRERSP
jgi:predicted PurR-regulated permease PerM